jgi:hypothetical protein
MLPELHRQAYQEFMKTLIALKNNFNSSNLDAIAIQNNFQLTQKFFQMRINSLSDESLSEETASRWRSLHTEIYRAFKLLETETILFRSAKQSTTQQQRLKSIVDRLTQIIGYCQMLGARD